MEKRIYTKQEAIARKFCDRIIKSDIVKKDGSLKKNYANVLTLLQRADREKIYLKRSSIRRVEDSAYRNALHVLHVLHLPARVGNDAPRGGAAHDYIMIADEFCPEFREFIDYFCEYNKNKCYVFDIETLNTYLKMWSRSSL